MELADLMSQLQFFGDDFMTEEIVSDNQRDAMPWYQRCQPSLHGLRIVFIDLPHGERLTCS